MRTVTLHGYTPYPHQRAVHQSMGDCYRNGHIYVVKSKRQVGKTTMAENIVLKMSAEHNGVLSVFVEPTLDQARRVYKELLKAVQDTPFLARKNDSLLELEFANGSQVLFKSAEQRDNLRGFTITGILVIDECAFILDEIYDILQPTTDVHSAPILMISTPKFKSGFYYRYYQAGRDGAENITSIDFNDFDTSMLLSPEKLEQYRKMMPKSQFTTEYLGEFLDTDSVLFTNIRECIADPDEDWEGIYFGIDWGTGGGGDYTSISAFNEKRQMILCDYFNDKGSSEQARYIADLIRGYGRKVKGILAESNSIGTPMIELLRETFDSMSEYSLSRMVTPFTTTNQEKVRLVSQLQVELEQQRIRLLGNEGLIRQLSMYEATYNPKTGVISYNAPLGSHDDNCISCMLALDAMTKGTKNAIYNISFNGRKRDERHRHN